MRSKLTMDRVWFSNNTPNSGSRTFPGSVPYMVYYRDRLLSFGNWPVQLQQKKHSLASAGFYYTNNSDIVKCFSCGLRLGNWLKDDDVWKEHQRWSPRCHYVNMVGFYRTSDRFLDTVT